MPKQNETHWFTGTVKRETPGAGGAYLIDAGGKAPFWLPKSQVQDSDKDLAEGVTAEIEIPLWLAEREDVV